MLPVAAFIAFWVVVGAGRVLRRDPRLVARRARSPPQGSRPALGGSGSFCSSSSTSASACRCPLAFLAGNHANASEQVGGITADRGREARPGAVRSSTAACATRSLPPTPSARSGRTSTRSSPPASLVLRTINNGCLQNPPSTSEPAELPRPGDDAGPDRPGQGRRGGRPVRRQGRRQGVAAPRAADSLGQTRQRRGNAVAARRRRHLRPDLIHI